MRHTRHTEQRALGAFALACYPATPAALLGAGHALLALALRAVELQGIVTLTRNGF